MVGRVASLERITVLIAELRCELTELTFACLRLERNRYIGGVGSLIIPSANPLPVVKCVLVMTQMNRIEILECIANEKHEGHR